MTATLQEKLNSLINYSSQLIFVSGDSLADQTKALEDFLFQQSENTELAYLIADKEFVVRDYRRDICQQLLGHSHTLFSRPLNECLASLNQHDGPVMIAITRAEKMPNAVLQELWELVLQSRFAANKQHLNVVLFGEKQWAAKAKQWLPDNNSDTPLLLHSQRTSFNSNEASGSYDPLIAKPLNCNNVIEQRPIISMAAFWAAITLVFVSTFVGLLIWLYGENVSSLFAPLSEPEIVTESEPKVTLEPQPLAAAQPQPQPTVIQWPNKVSNSPVKSDTVEPKPPVNLIEDQKPAIPMVEQHKPEPAPSISAEQSSGSEQLAVPFEKNKYVIQIAGLQNTSLLTAFLTQNKLEELTWRYQTERNGKAWTVVVIAQHFSSPLEAKNAIATLPEFTGKEQAFVKSTDSIIKELRKPKTQATIPKKDVVPSIE